MQPPLSPSLSQSVGWWRKLWRMEVSNKMKNFVWHTCREALPTKANLCRRRIVPNSVCDKCKMHTEDCSHALFFCFDVQVVWASDPQCRDKRRERSSSELWRKTRILIYWHSQVGHYGTKGTRFSPTRQHAHWTRYWISQRSVKMNFSSFTQASRSSNTGSIQDGNL